MSENELPRSSSNFTSNNFFQENNETNAHNMFNIDVLKINHDTILIEQFKIYSLSK